MRGAIAVACPWFCISFATGHAQDVVVSSATVIDGRGGPPRERTTIVSRRGRLTAIGPDSTMHLPSGATVIDGHGRWVIPGLIEVHTHDFPNTKDPLKQALALGVATCAVPRGLVCQGDDRCTSDVRHSRRLHGRVPGQRVPWPDPARATCLSDARPPHCRGTPLPWRDAAQDLAG
jgi:hypothetical protein